MNYETTKLIKNLTISTSVEMDNLVVIKYFYHNLFF